MSSFPNHGVMAWAKRGRQQKGRRRAASATIRIVAAAAAAPRRQVGLRAGRGRRWPGRRTQRRVVSANLRHRRRPARHDSAGRAPSRPGGAGRAGTAAARPLPSDAAGRASESRIFQSPARPYGSSLIKWPGRDCHRDCQAGTPVSVPQSSSTATAARAESDRRPGREGRPRSTVVQACSQDPALVQQ